MIKYASIGSISTGTLKPEDLLNKFWDELEYQLSRQDALEAGEREEIAQMREAHGQIQDKLWDEDGNVIDDDEEVSGAIEELEGMLETFAGPYRRFGAHEGDGADFGYWPDHDAIDELPAYPDKEAGMAACEHGDTEATRNENFKVVNGSDVAVYDGLGTVLLELV